MLSGRNTGGKEEEKSLEISFARCQKSRGGLDLERF